MRCFLIFLLLPLLLSCRFFATSAREEDGDESVRELTLDYRKWYPFMAARAKIAANIQSKSEKTIYDIRIKITIQRVKGPDLKEYFSIRKINPYENYAFERKSDAEKGDEVVMEIQSSHY